MKKSTLLTSLFVIGLFTGCAGGQPSPDDKSALLTKTAKFFGTSSENITINNFESGLIALGYKATYQGTLYNCFRHNIYRFVQCKKPGY